MLVWFDAHLKHNLVTPTIASASTDCTTIASTDCTTQDESGQWRIRWPKNTKEMSLGCEPMRGLAAQTQWQATQRQHWSCQLQCQCCE